jgi:20S proteasome alpha/beta subunit
MNSLEQDLNWYQLCKKDMTYILGARCKDGVVLVGDTKVTIGGGTDVEYAKKITFPLTNVVMGSAGSGGLYKDFQNRVVSKVQREGGVPTKEQFSTLITKEIRGMHEDYGKHNERITYELMILCATRIGGPISDLDVFTGYGYPLPVNQIRAIGHGEPYGALFHKKLWNENMTMEQTAKLGLFVIKFIEDMQLDNSVGHSEEFLPQVVYIPYVIEPVGFKRTPEEIERLTKEYPIKELLPNEVKKFMDEIKPNVSIVDSWFKEGKFKI